MPRLIVLNGPPGIGKSTLAQLYVDEHPGVLNLDIDQVARLIGGARSAGPKLTLARSDALAMARTHLQAGYDVLVPQFIGRITELERFEDVAADAGATFLHIVLMESREGASARFAERGRATQAGWVQDIHAEVAAAGGADLLAAMFDALADVIRARLTSVLLTSEAGAAQRTYDLLVAALSEDTSPPPPRGVAVVLDSGRVLVIERRRKGLEYAVLPGGGVEQSESAAEAALRELHEETSLVGRVDRQLWQRFDDGREATYFLMIDVRGTPVLSGEEALEHSPDNSFVLSWATADDLDRIRLQPAQIRGPLADVVRTAGRTEDPRTTAGTPPDP